MAERILLVQLADIGDMILTTPALAALRSARPDAHLTLLAARHTLAVVDADLIDETIALERRGFNQTLGLLNPATLRQLRDLRQYDFDTVVFFHQFTLRLGRFKFWLIAHFAAAERVIGLQKPNQNVRFLTDSVPDEGFGAQHQAQYWLNLVSVLGAERDPRRAQVAFDDGILPLAMHRGIRVIIHAGGGDYSQARRWSPAKFAQVADELVTAHNAQIVLVGTVDDDADVVADAMTQASINLTGKTTLTQLADVLRSADLFIGTDSGVLHMAAAVRTPVVSIFGPSNPAAWGAWSPGGTVVTVRSAPICSPCNFIGHEIGLREGCAARTCMKMVSAQQVTAVARAIIDGTPPPPASPPSRTRDWTQTIQVLGLPVDNISYNQWMDLIDQWVQQGTRLHHVCTVNPEFLMIAQRDALFRQILRRSDLNVPDGAGLLWAAHRLNTPLQERVTGSDGVVRIAQEAAERGWKLFFLGAGPGIAEYAKFVLEEQFFGLNIVGTYEGSPRHEEEQAIVERINASRADVLLVAYGAPKQDKWIARNAPRLTVKMAMGVGGSLDFIAGKVPRAPQWMQERGLEWLYRLYREPWRIARMMRLPRFVLAVLTRGAK